MELGDFTLDVFSLQGRRAIVTGGNTGLGQACTVALAAAGADVLVAGVADDGGRTEALVTERGRRHVFVEADLTHPDTPRRVVEHCVAELGGLDVLVNSAGICLVDDVDGFDDVSVVADGHLGVHGVAQGDGTGIVEGDAFEVQRGQGGGSCVRHQTILPPRGVPRVARPARP